MVNTICTFPKFLSSVKKRPLLLLRRECWIDEQKNFPEENWIV
jgi:hypothetical protein